MNDPTTPDAPPAADVSAIVPSASPPPPPGAPVPSAAPPPTHADEGDVSRLVRVRWWVVVPALALAALAFLRLHAIGLAPREERAREAAAAQAAYDPRPSVETVAPKRGTTSFDLRLPADVDSIQETAVFARTTGYLKSVLVDIGDPVAALAPIAELDLPDVDAQIVVANASVAVAEANVAKARLELGLAESTLKRFVELARSKAVVAQDVDERRSAVAQAASAVSTGEAGVTLAKAEVLRLTTLRGFGHVVAPFAGVVTARGYDVGALVGPSGGSAATPLFRIERGDVLRVWVNLPQTFAASATPKAKGYLTVRNRPGREFPCELRRTAGVLDPTTRTLRCQLEVANEDGALASGMFGELRFPVVDAQPSLTVPTSAPTFGASGPTVWTVDGTRVKAKTVTLGRDFGTDIEVTSGLLATDRVVRNPGERLVDGLEVHVSSDAAPPAAAGPPR